MSKAIYIAATESDSGKSLVSLGLLRMMLTKSSKVGYFRPIINEVKSSAFDDHTNTAINFFNLDIAYNDCYAYKQGEVVELLSEGKADDVIHNVIKKYKKLEAKYDYVLVEGTDFSGEGGFTELDVNLMIAKNLGIPALIVGSGNGKKKKDFINTMQLTHQSFINKEVDVIGIIANKIEVDEIDYIQKELQKSFPKNLQIDIIPKIDFLSYPTVREVVKALNGSVLFGKQFLNNVKYLYNDLTNIEFIDGRGLLQFDDKFDYDIRKTLGYYSRFFNDRSEGLNKELLSVRFRPEYYQLAELIAKSLGDFNGAHLRLTDHIVRVTTHTDAFNNGLSNLQGNLPIVLATDEPNSSMIANSGYDLILLDDYILKNFYSIFIS